MVKGIKFQDLKDAGDPVEQVRLFVFLCYDIVLCYAVTVIYIYVSLILWLVGRAL